MLVFEILTGSLREMDSEFEPSEDEIKAIQLDKILKKRPKAHNKLFTVMTGSEVSEPAF